MAPSSRKSSWSKDILLETVEPRLSARPHLGMPLDATNTQFRANHRYTTRQFGLSSAISAKPAKVTLPRAPCDVLFYVRTGPFKFRGDRAFVACSDVRSVCACRELLADKQQHAMSDGGGLSAHSEAEDDE